MVVHGGRGGNRRTVQFVNRACRLLTGSYCCIDERAPAHAFSVIEARAATGGETAWDAIFLYKIPEISFLMPLRGTIRENFSLSLDLF